MLLLCISLFFHYGLLNCDVFENAKFNSNGPLTTGHEATRHHNCTITDIMWNSTPGTDQRNRVIPHYSVLLTPIGHGKYIQSPTDPTPKVPYFQRFPQAIRRNQKITQQNMSNGQLKNITVNHQAGNQLEIKVLDITREIKNPEAKVSSYDPVKSTEPALHRIKRSHTLPTGTKKKLFPNLLLSDGKGTIADDTTNDEVEKTFTQMDVGEEILRTRERSKMTKKFEYPDWMETSATTAKIQFLRQNTAPHPYFGMIETLQEGYMIVFLIELTRLIATKEMKAVRDVVKHTDHIIYGLYQKGQLMWFGKPLLSVTMKVARFLKDSEIDVIQDHAANLHHMLNQRHQELSIEVNTILEYADMLYDDDEGRLLFDTLKEFAAYPNISLNGYWLCNSLIYNFLRPYRRLKGTKHRQELVDSVNLSLQSNQKSPLRSDDVRQVDDPSDAENQTSPQTEAVSQTEPLMDTTWSPRDSKTKRHHRPPVTQTEPHRGTTRPPTLRKRKRHHRTLKRKRERKRHRIHRPEYIQRYYQNHLLESKTQRPVQSGYRVKMKNTYGFGGYRLER